MTSLATSSYFMLGSGKQLYWTGSSHVSNVLSKQNAINRVLHSQILAFSLFYELALQVSASYRAGQVTSGL